jgi:periplasmic divalent cation tolerance protein
MNFLKRYHPYDVPEIISIKLEDVETDYANWLNMQLSGKK